MTPKRWKNYLGQPTISTWSRPTKLLSQEFLYVLQGQWALAIEAQKRCFHVSPLMGAAAKVAMSKFDAGIYLPYEKLNKNLGVIRKRYDPLPTSPVRAPTFARTQISLICFDFHVKSNEIIDK